ncbi:universal stress protein UspA-like protein [Halovivax ruber XH-70]|uniref:Universal stress protein UspA-like protein n=1 Tax=Halovivax ruber (strain DSM 18193 / JCM 13892 / XH-70) TaxID=797302 RepID=L0IDA0_HALRX|nr:universal stress protein [Halovivax ruber]AGB17535.1 universal stress protein UspA-like protein [Halovivax ruber XH-70]
MGTTVLVPVDGSSQSDDALAEAFELFPDARVVVLHVVQVTRIPSDPEVSPYELARAEGEAILEEARELAAANGRAVETELVEGNAPRTIVEAIDDHDADHVVMGSTGRSGLSRVVLGSVAEAVTRRSPVSVTIVR